MIIMKQVIALIITTLICFTSFSQNAADTTDKRFHDDLLDHLVGNWHDTAVAHGSVFTSEIDAHWVLNH
jgi:hypothetical protein